MSKGKWSAETRARRARKIVESVTINVTPENILQERIDILVAQHPDATTRELVELWEQREEHPLRLSMLRWPPGVAKPHWADPPKPLSKSAVLEYTGPRTPLVNDLLNKLAERPKKGRARPTGPVDYGNKSEPGEKD